VQVSCGIEALRFEVVHALEVANLTLQSTLNLLLDAPLGFALQGLAQLNPKLTMVVTDNPCPEYWDDIWALHPQVLLAGGHNLNELFAALERADKGERLRKTPYYTPVLSRQERAVLMYWAKGFSNKEIGEQLKIKESAVKCYLHRVFVKLDLTSRVQASLYYWGMWHLLPTRE